MKKFLCGLIVGIIISGNLYAFRTARPPTFTKLDDPVQLTQLNSFLQNIYDITNGRISLDTRESDGRSDNGDVWILESGSTHQFKWKAGGIVYSVTGTP